MNIQQAKLRLYITSYACASFALGIVSNVYGSSTSYVAALAKCQETDLVPVVAGVGICFIVGALPAACLMDHPASSHLMFGVCLLLQALSIFVSPSCTSLTCVTICFSGQALTYNLVGAGTIVLSMQLFPQSQNILVNLMCAATALGSTAAPVLISFCSLFAGGNGFAYYRTGYYSISALTAAISLWVFWVGSPAALPKPSLPALSLERLKSYDWAIIGPSLVGIFANMSVQATYGTWVFTYATHGYSLGDAAARSVNASFWAAYTMGGIASTALAHVLSPETVMLAMTPLSILGALAATLAPAASHSLTTLALCSAAVGLGTASGFANMIALAVRLGRTVDALLSTLFSTVAGLGTVVLPVLLPLLARPLGIGVLMWLTAAAGALQLVLVPLVLLAGRTATRRRLRECLAGERAALLGGKGEGEEGDEGITGNERQGELAATDSARQGITVDMAQQ